MMPVNAFREWRGRSQKKLHLRGPVILQALMEIEVVLREVGEDADVELQLAHAVKRDGVGVRPPWRNPCTPAATISARMRSSPGASGVVRSRARGEPQ